MSKENSEDVVLSLEQEEQREMFLSMDEIIKERFDQLHVLARKYSNIKPCNLLNDDFEHEINYFIDIDKNNSILKEKVSRFLWLYIQYKKRHYVRKTGEKAPLIY